MSADDFLVTLNIHMGGSLWCEDDEIKYVGGCVEKYERKFDIDYFSWFSFVDILKENKLPTVNAIWYKRTKEAMSCLRPIREHIDSEIRDLISLARTCAEIDVFIEHKVSDGPVISGLLSGADVGDDVGDGCDLRDLGHDVADDIRDGCDLADGGADAGDDVGDACDLGDVGHDVSDGGVDVGDNVGDACDLGDVGHDVSDGGSDDGVNDGSDDGVGDVGDGGSFEHYTYSVEFAEYISDPERYDRGNEFPSTPEITDDEGKKEVDSEIGKYPMHGSSGRSSDHNLFLGKTFNTGDDFKEELVQYVLDSKFNVKFSRCESRKIAAICCEKDCPWRIYCSVHAGLNRWMIKTFVDGHNHPKRTHADLLNSSRIAKIFLEDLRKEPSLSANKIQSRMQEKFQMIVSRCQCFKARRIALGTLVQDQNAQFAKLWDYEAEIRRGNPNTTTEIGTTVAEDGTILFDRFYVCFEVLRETWKRHCRPIIGLDGCFLKWSLKGELLAAIGRDGDNRIYPIAWAVVRVENNFTWAWFLRRLKQDLGLGEGANLTIHSDKQKGLIRAIAEELPYCEHRMCARHIYANWKKQFKDIEYKKFFWSAAHSYSKGEFVQHITALKEFNTAAYEALVNTDPKHWSRAFFRETSKCGDINNNLNESYNSSIRDARLRPVVDMLEDIRRKTMQRIAKRFKEATKCVTEFSPHAMEELEKARKNGGYCMVIPSGHGKYEVMNLGISYSVDLVGKTCACRQWDVTGIPCTHGLAVINQRRDNLSLYVSHYFSKEKWVATYENNILPLNGEIFWRKTMKDPLGVPIPQSMPGRPRKFHRKKDPHESPSKSGHISRHGRKMTCTKCKQVGHNIKTCKNEPYQVHGPPRGPGRPRKFLRDGEPSRRPPTRKRKTIASNSVPAESSANSVAEGNI
ncbi:PREDICTED: uncharacterized protein LOC104811292 [Tarenaya hassleriana]|uniref:uncharacterized protein LOC104811292 n=1 Tax=Tarenaya hassleriana TaxID=28532 RepID=UPI00053C33D5|nr:PREDICTED: uncharacterized protein LOC104811292 [Tarenaya hassleriana]